MTAVTAVTAKMVRMADDHPTALSVLAVAPTLDRGYTATRLLAFASGLGALGHRMRLVTAMDSTIPELRARDIPCWLVYHPRVGPHLAETLAAYAHAVYHALRAEPTHIIQCTSIPMTYAATLATFAYTLRHPAAPEPAIVTTVDGSDNRSGVEPDDAIDASVRAGRHLRLLGDCIVVFSEQARATLVRGGQRSHLGERVHLVTPGRDLDTAAMVAVYHMAWARRQSINRRTLLPVEL